MKKRNVLFDLIIYSVTSFRYLLLKGKLIQFLQDMSFFPQWRFYKTSEKSLLYYRIPWLVFGSVSFLEKKLSKRIRVFEYGSGGSTLFFSERAESVYSIEHDFLWYSKVKAEINRLNVTNVHYSLVEPVAVIDAAGKDCRDPQNYLSCFAEYKELTFSGYVKAIDEHADASFDLVIIDGRARPSCIAHSMRKLKKGGILLVDNADRAYYLQPFPELLNASKWEQKEFKGHCPFGLTSVLYTTQMFIKQ
jgi:hypothetical protein